MKYKMTNFYCDHVWFVDDIDKDTMGIFYHIRGPERGTGGIMNVSFYRNSNWQSKKPSPQELELIKKLKLEYL